MNDLSPRLREFLDSARREERPRPGQKELVRAALGPLVSPALTLAPGSTAAPVAAASAGIVTKVVVSAFVVGVLGAGALWWKLSPVPQPSPPPNSAPRAEPVRESTTAPPPVEPAHAPAKVTETPKRPPRVTRSASSSPPVRKDALPASVPEAPPAPAATEAPCAFGEELELVRQGQLALNEGRADEALRLLERHRSRCPRGALAEERDGARILALCQLRQWDQARAESARFRATSPTSPLWSRIDRACGAPGGPVKP